MKTIRNFLIAAVLISGITAFGMKKEESTYDLEKERAALFDAVHNDIQAVENVLQRAPDTQILVNGSPHGIAILREAATLGDAEIVDRLLNAGANPNPEDSYNITPLMMAALGGHVDIVARLINAGAIVNAEDNSLQTALNFVDFGTATPAQKEAIRTLLQNAQQ